MKMKNLKMKIEYSIYFIIFVWCLVGFLIIILNPNNEKVIEFNSIIEWIFIQIIDVVVFVFILGIIVTIFYKPKIHHHNCWGVNGLKNKKNEKTSKNSEILSMNDLQNTKRTE